MSQDKDTYRVKLEIFEGPLDLLLYLIRKNEIDIYDIPIALIVEQYMAYLDLMKTLNLEVAGEFIVMAATLSHIKSRMLLPREEEESGEGEEGEDPRAELVRRLLEYEKFKKAAEELASRTLLGRDVFVRPPDQEAVQEAAKTAGIPSVTFAEVGLFELIDALKEVMERAKIKNWHEVLMERVSIMDRIHAILELLRNADSITFDQLFKDQRDKPSIIATFLALLELVRLRVIKARQEKPFGTIHLLRAVEIDDDWLAQNLPRLERETG